MITVVIGKSGSGKSDFAESLAMKYPGRRYYIATMKVIDDDGEERVRRHRLRREGKGFTTFEIPVDIEKVKDIAEDAKNSVVLLECVVNLAGNMMHDIPDIKELCQKGDEGIKEASRRVAKKVMDLSEHISQLIVVTGEYDPDPADDEETVAFKKLLKEVNIILKSKADHVYDSADINMSKGERI